MPEPVITLGAGAIAAYLAKDGLQKLLGPTADYLGNGLKDLTQKRTENIGKIFSKASTKLGDALDQPGSIPPKLLKQVVDDGSFADDEVEIEYLSGVVASSRSDRYRDNRGVSIAKLIDSLSNYQLRAHYLIYRSIRDAYLDAGISPMGDGRDKLAIVIPAPAFFEAMEFKDSEAEKFQVLLSHIFFGLNNSGLIGNHFEFGPKETMEKYIPNADFSGIMCKPSASGVDLFLWAFGDGDHSLTRFFSNDFDPRIEGIPLGVAEVKKVAQK